MGAKQEPTDLVLSYVVTGTGVKENAAQELNEALAKGYRVLDVLATQPGGSAGGQFVVVTVVLSKQWGQTGETHPPYHFFGGSKR